MAGQIIYFTASFLGCRIIYQFTQYCVFLGLSDYGSYLLLNILSNSLATWDCELAHTSLFIISRRSNIFGRSLLYLSQNFNSLWHC